MKIQLSDERMALLKNGYPMQEISTRRIFDSQETAKTELKKNNLMEFSNTVDQMDEFMFFPQKCYFWEGHYSYSVPAQGWKMHISASDRKDYLYLLDAIIPVLNILDCVYKVVNPIYFEQFAEGKGGSQTGKYITVYLGNKRNFECFVAFLDDYAYNVLMEGSVPVPGETHIAGRMYARYGAFIDPEYLLDPDGNIVEDVRGHVCPSWIDENELADVLKVRRSMS